MKTTNSYTRSGLLSIAAAALAILPGAIAQQVIETTVIDEWDCYVVQKDQNGESVIGGPTRLGGTVQTVTNGSNSQPIPASGSVFEIWAIKPDASAANILVDHQVVGPWPTAEITVSSRDPFVNAAGEHRTRVDQPFSVSVSIDGILPPINPGSQAGEMANPMGSREVIVRREAVSYVDYGPAVAASGEPVLRSFTANNSNPGYTIVGNDTSIIPGANPVGTTGQETFSAWGVAAGDSPDQMFPVVRLDEVRLNVFPLHSMEFSGIESGRAYQTAPDIQFRVEDAYPGATVTFSFFKASQGYQADSGLPEHGVLSLPGAPSFQVAYDASTPRDYADLILDTLDSVMTTDGTYYVAATYRVLDQAGNDVYPPETVMSEAIIISTIISVNGAVISSE